MDTITTINTIHANPELSIEAKRAQIHDIKGKAHLEALADHIGKPIRQGDYTITITQLPEHKGNQLIFRGIKLFKNDIEVKLDLPLYIVNPPMLVSSAPGEYISNPAQAIISIIMGLAK